MLSFGLGICSSIKLPDLPDRIVKPIWAFATTQTGMTIAQRPEASKFIITKVSADGATIQRG